MGQWACPKDLAKASWTALRQEPTDMDDPHLRCVREVTGYHIQGSDKGIGHVKDFLVDDETWAIRYLVVDTSNWGLGNNVLLAPQWIEQVSSPEAQGACESARDRRRAARNGSLDRPSVENMRRAYTITTGDRNIGSM